ncbi:nuclear pore complex protein NUP50A-like [Panicum miliaceum]|uniref:Nuclear pore complex protein NUP50A-like n=2 Tax=Mesangiospermae TaxID=1437183 RepID=A0A3L6R6M3_PANMI|nr:nuclear pore complex protein NUP50A-like [Panicum miliaceum]
MADDEQVPSSRKRVAGTQINKDNPEPDDDGPEQEMGTFKKAPEEVMATRRIVKVRRQQPSSAPSSNPFSAIRFTPTDSSVHASAPVTEPQPSEVKTDEGSNGSGKDTLPVPDKNAGSGEVTEIQKDESAVKTDSGATTEALPQPVETSDKAEDTKDGSGGDIVVGEPKEGDSMPSEVEGKTNDGDAAEKEGADEAGNEDKISKDDTEKKDGGESETKDGLSDEQKDADNKGQSSSAAPLFSFKNLSSGQNAFTGLAGTGFSSTSFSFGSASKDGSSAGPLFGLKTDGSSFPSFNLGATNNGSSSTALATSGEAPKKFAMTEGPVETGEENEKAVFTADSALYEYLDGGWKERGKGELKLNVPVSGDERARLVMRTKGNYRLVLNASLYDDMSLKDMDKKGVTFACMNSIGESQGGLATFALKFKDTATREEFKGAVEAHKARKAPDVPLKTPENSPKASEV